MPQKSAVRNEKEMLFCCNMIMVNVVFLDESPGKENEWYRDHIIISSFLQTGGKATLTIEEQRLNWYYERVNITTNWHTCAQMDPHVLLTDIWSHVWRTTKGEDAHENISWCSLASATYNLLFHLVTQVLLLTTRIYRWVVLHVTIVSTELGLVGQTSYGDIYTPRPTHLDTKLRHKEENNDVVLLPIIQQMPNYKLILT